MSFVPTFSVCSCLGKRKISGVTGRKPSSSSDRQLNQPMGASLPETPVSGTETSPLLKGQGSSGSETLIAGSAYRTPQNPVYESVSGSTMSPEPSMPVLRMPWTRLGRTNGSVLNNVSEDPFGPPLSNGLKASNSTPIPETPIRHVRRPSILLTPADGSGEHQLLLTDQVEIASTQEEDASSDHDDCMFPTFDRPHKDPSLLDLDLDIFPETIRCILYLDFEHKERHEKREYEFPLPWFQKDVYDKLCTEMDAIRKSAQQALNCPCEDYKVYPKQGVFRITFLGTEGQRSVKHCLPYVEIEPKTMRQEVVKYVCGFIHDYPFKHGCAKVEMHWDYSTICISPTGKDTYREMLEREVRRKMVKKNFRNQTYIARSDLGQFLRQDVIEKSLKGDEVFMKEFKEKSPKYRDELIQRVQTFAPRLHAICVYNRWPLYILQHWLEGGLTDVDHRSHALNAHSCDRPDSCQIIFEEFKEERHKFFPHKWGEEGDKKFNEFDKDTILPIRILPIQSPDQDNTIGKGANSEVYKVQIDLDHHRFQGDRNCKFALKQFRSRSNRASIQRAFTKERQVLEQLSKFDNPHVVTHLSCWSQNYEYFILYPLAKMNMASLMAKTRPKATKVNLLWFLRSMKGLTDGLRFIHMLSVPNNSLAPGPDKRNIYTFHHDLKPENLLVYPDLGRRHGCVLKIADFGAGMVDFLGSNGKSRSLSDPVGTPAYQGPERKRSRPSDIWALGCVFLEYLMWFTTHHFCRDTFSSERLDKNPAKEDGVNDDTFWCKKGGITQLSPPVESNLVKLESMVYPFPDLAKVIRLMLKPATVDRILAADLDLKIEQIFTQMETELRDKSDTHLLFKDDSAVNLQISQGGMDIDARSVVSGAGSPTRDSGQDTGSPRERPSRPISVSDFQGVGLGVSESSGSSKDALERPPQQIQDLDHNHD